MKIFMMVTNAVKVEVDNVDKNINALVIFPVFEVEVCDVIQKKYTNNPENVELIRTLMTDVNTPNQDILNFFEGYLNIAKPKMFATETSFEMKFGRFKER